MNPSKTREERLNEALEFRRKFQHMGLLGGIPEMDKIFAILSEYVKNGEPASGSIRGAVIKKRIAYSLRPQKDKTSEMFLRKL